MAELMHKEDGKIYVSSVLSNEEEEEESEEGYLSSPEIRVKVTRPTQRVRIKAQDLCGREFEQVGEGCVTRVW